MKTDVKYLTKLGYHLLNLEQMPPANLVIMKDKLALKVDENARLETVRHQLRTELARKFLDHRDEDLPVHVWFCDYVPGELHCYPSAFDALSNVTGRYSQYSVVAKIMKEGVDISPILADYAGQMLYHTLKSRKAPLDTIINDLIIDRDDNTSVLLNKQTRSTK